MVANATHGFMLRDGKSRGTLANIRNLARGGKPVAVHLSSTGTFVNVKTAAELDLWLASCQRR